MFPTDLPISEKKGSENLSFATVLREMLNENTSDQEISELLDKEFSEEFAILRTANTPVRSGEDELARTKKSIMSAIWMHKENYESFTDGQPKGVKLTPIEFDKARAYLGLTKSQRNISQLVTLCYSIAVNDIGKSSEWAKKVADIQERPELINKNHDVILKAGAQLGLVSCLERLSADQKQLVLDGIEMGSELNAPAWMQGEAPAGTLSGLLTMQGKPEAFNLKKAEIYHDVAGAKVTNNGTWMLQPMSKAFIDAFTILDDLIEEEISIVEAYKQPFDKLANYLNRHMPVGILESNLSTSKPQDLALLRLMSMGRTITAELDKHQMVEQVKCYLKAFDNLPSEIRQNLIEGLSVTGIDDGEAVFLYMAPELFVRVLNEFRDSDSEKKVQGLSVVMKALSDKLNGTKPVEGQPGNVVTHDLNYLLPLVKSSAFTQNPDILLEDSKNYSSMSPSMSS